MNEKITFYWLAEDTTISTKFIRRGNKIIKKYKWILLFVQLSEDSAIIYNNSNRYEIKFNYNVEEAIETFYKELLYYESKLMNNN